MADAEKIAQSLAVQPEMRSYEPSWRERIAYTLADAAGAIGAGRYAQQDIASGVRNVADFVPVVGDVLGLNDAYRDFKDGNYGQAAAGLGLAAVGAVPGVGDAAEALAKKAIPYVHDVANQLANALRSRGFNVSNPSHSTNRYGQFSSYINSPLGELRISDHGRNADFDTSSMTIPVSGSNFDVNAEADAIIKQYQAAIAAKEQAELAKRESMAPYIEAFRSSTNDQQRNEVLKSFIESGIYGGPRSWDAVSREDRKQLRKTLMGE